MYTKRSYILQIGLFYEKQQCAYEVASILERLGSVIRIVHVVLKLNSIKQKVSLPVVRSHTTVHHADVFGYGLHFVNTSLVVQDGLLFLFCCQDNSI